MPPVQVALVIVSLVAVASLIGIAIRVTSGRASQSEARDDDTTATRLGVDLGERATLVQFSTPVCSACGPTRVALTGIADATAGVRHVEIDLARHPEFADRFSIRQTPTTFVLDRDGTLRARIGGAPRPGVVQTELDRVLAQAKTPSVPHPAPISGDPT